MGVDNAKGQLVGKSSWATRLRPNELQRRDTAVLPERTTTMGRKNAILDGHDRGVPAKRADALEGSPLIETISVNCSSSLPPALEYFI